MPTYIVIGNFTAKGLKTIKEFPKAMKAAKKMAEKIGGSIKEFYFTLGRFDFCCISEAPNAEALLTSLLTAGLMGTVNTETLTAIPADKVTDIIKNLP